MKIEADSPDLHRITGALPGRLLIAAALAVTASGCQKPAPPAPPPPVVQVMEAAKSEVARSMSFIGQLDSPQNVELRARVEAFVDKILFQEGSEVNVGDPLFELNKQPYEEQLAAAKGKRAEAVAALNKSQDDVARLTPLVAKNAVPKKDLDAAQSAVEVHQAEVDSATARIKSAELDIGYCDVKAPIAGRIGSKEVSVGALVGKGEPTLLATISQIDPIWFYCSISEVDFLQSDKIAREGGRKFGELPVDLTLSDGSEHPKKGKWIFLDRVVDPTTATIRARAEFPNPTKALRPGMFARARVSLPAGENAFLIPERALTELQGKNFVWVIGADNKAQQRPVEAAPNRVGSDVVILAGLQPGERVVVEGVQKLRDGGLVQAMPEPRPTPTAKAAEAGSAPQSETKPGKE